MTREEINQWCRGQCPGGAHHEGSGLVLECDECIRKLLLSERERCARVCEEAAERERNGYQVMASEECARRIRSGT